MRILHSAYSHIAAKFCLSHYLIRTCLDDSLSLEFYPHRHNIFCQAANHLLQGRFFFFSSDNGKGDSLQNLGVLHKCFLKIPSGCGIVSFLEPAVKSRDSEWWEWNLMRRSKSEG